MLPKNRRAEIYCAIDGEREYQRKKWGKLVESSNLTVEENRTVGEFITFMQNYLNKAITKATEMSGNNGALDEIRKVVALGVACMEQNGVVHRDNEPVPNVHARRVV